MADEAKAGDGRPGGKPGGTPGGTPGGGTTGGPRSRFLSGGRIDPRRIDGRENVADLIDGTFLAYNAARLREACHLFTSKMLADDVTVGMSITGALTPAGLGMAALIPLVEAGFIDWIVSTGANLYHDTHFGLGLSMHRGHPQASDVVLRAEGVVRIYDIFFDYDVLLSTDAFFRQIIRAPEFQRPMSSAEFHHLCGKYVARARARPRSQLQVAAVGGVYRRRAGVHILPGRFVHRDERGGAGAGRQRVHDRSEPGCQRDRGNRPGRQAG